MGLSVSLILGNIIHHYFELLLCSVIFFLSFLGSDHLYFCHYFPAPVFLAVHCHYTSQLPLCSCLCTSFWNAPIDPFMVSHILSLIVDQSKVLPVFIVVFNYICHFCYLYSSFLYHYHLLFHPIYHFYIKKLYDMHRCFNPLSDNTNTLCHVWIYAFEACFYFLHSISSSIFGTTFITS